MAIDDRRVPQTFATSRNFLHRDRRGLIVAPAVVQAEALMPIIVWRPTFWQPRNVGMGPVLSCRADELIGVDLRSLGLPKPSTFSGSPGQLFWPYGLHPLESLPQSRIRIASFRETLRLQLLSPIILLRVLPWRRRGQARSPSEHGRPAAVSTALGCQPSAAWRRSAYPILAAKYPWCPLMLIPSGRLSAISSHSLAAWRTGQLNPKPTFKGA